MDSFLFAAKAILPILLLMAVGYFIRNIKLVDDNFLTVGNRFCFYVLIPALLFTNVYSIDGFTRADLTFVGYALLAVLAAFALSFPLTIPYRKDPGKRGAIAQDIFRTNYAIIGLALAGSLFGEEGTKMASMLTIVTVPVYNLLAVVVLSIFCPDNDKDQSRGDVFKKIIKGIITNPLIIACLLGGLCQLIRTLFVKQGITWRLSDLTVLFGTLKTLGAMSTSLSLVILGGRFHFSAVGRLWKDIAYGCFLRLVLVPAAALGIAYHFIPGLTGAHFAAYIAAFGTPAAVASAVMAAEMHSDEELAGQLVVWTSTFSMFTLFLLVMLFRSIGIF